MGRASFTVYRQEMADLSSGFGAWIIQTVVPTFIWPASTVKHACISESGGHPQHPTPPTLEWASRFTGVYQGYVFASDDRSSGMMLMMVVSCDVGQAQLM